MILHPCTWSPPPTPSDTWTHTCSPTLTYSPYTAAHDTSIHSHTQSNQGHPVFTMLGMCLVADGDTGNPTVDPGLTVAVYTLYCSPHTYPGLIPTAAHRSTPDTYSGVRDSHSTRAAQRYTFTASPGLRHTQIHAGTTNTQTPLTHTDVQIHTDTCMNTTPHSHIHTPSLYMQPH